MPRRNSSPMTKKCPLCAEEIQAEAVKCRHCGSDLDAHQKAQQKQKDTAIGCAALFVIGVLFYAWASWKDSTPEAQKEGAERDAAPIVTVICEREMTSRLRSPGSADYPFGHAAAVESLGDIRYRLRSYVDSQNAFGALVRTHFVCEVTGGGDDIENYNVTTLSVIE